MVPLIAEADPIFAGSGWTGAGLLGAVLAWLLFRHLPAKDEQVRQLIDRHDSGLKEARTEFRGALETVVAHCEREMAKHADGMTSLSEAVDKLTEAVSELRGTR